MYLRTGQIPQGLRFRRPPGVERPTPRDGAFLTVILDRLRNAVLHVPPAAWQEIADQQITEPERFVPDRSYFKLHRT